VTAGRVRLTVARTDHSTDFVEAYGGVFKTLQRRAAHPVTDLVLRGGSYAGCPAAIRSVRAQTGAAPRSRRVRSLWAKGKGRFRTTGRYGTATVRGTWWFTEDRCDGTRVKVQEGTVAVRDLVRRRTVLVPAGHAYLARARR
jgi:hypothetical protein